MALVLAYLTIGFVDSEGVPASTNIPIQVDETVVLNTLLVEADLIATAAIALSEDAVTELKFTVVMNNPGPLTPGADSDSQEGLLLNYRVNGSKYPQEIWIPALIDALTVNGKIDLGNAALVHLTSELTTQVDVQGTNKFQFVITTLRDAAESFRKLKRLATKKSRSRA
jgi:hypothetical protein